MKIALLGYGKMGKIVEEIALKRGHSIVLKIDADVTNYDISKADIAIEFSTPHSAFTNITHALKAGVPVVAGTTGWLSQYDDAVQVAREHNGSFLYASNFSIGVNVFFEINRKLASLMGQFNNYAASIEEIHHTQKLDAPSGTAISLANEIINQGHYTRWYLSEENNHQEGSLPITALRIDKTPGTHTVTYKSEVDTIDIKHTAHSREGFALGAVLASEWLMGKKGVFSMKDVLGL